MRWRLFRRRTVAAIILGTAALVAVGAYLVFYYAPAAPQPAGALLPSSVKLISAMLHKSAPHPSIHMADASQPAPTNSWYSSLVFAEPSQPVYAYPWTLATTPTGATLSVPSTKSTPDTVLAEHHSDLQVDVGANTAAVGPHNDMSVVVDYQKSGKTVASSRLTHGSPYVFFNSKNGRAAITATGTINRSGDHSFIITVSTQRYGLWLPDGAKAQLNGTTISLQTKRFTLVALPHEGSDTQFFAAAGNQITAASASYETHGDASTTTFNVKTANGQPTVLGLLPHQYQHMDALHTIGWSPTLLGPQKFMTGNDFSYTLTRHVPSSKIITRKLSSSQTAKLTALLHKDANNLRFDKTDVYFAGKQLYRAANLLELAHELQQPSTAKTVQQKLAGQLDQWLDPTGYKSRHDKYFYYDPVIHGVVGVTPSFGNERFNDHHFQYGYFIYAASVLGRYDRTFVRKNAGMVNVLVKDIANPAESRYFPQLRNFDAYSGHSWADGYGLFADGNNQESSSEAANAWYAVYLWAQTIGNPKLVGFGQWLYQNEANAATAYWLNPDLGQPQFKNYKHSTVGIVWGGKLDYATFFSNKPAAPLGIQLIPMSPGQSYVASSSRRTEQNLAALSNQPISQFKDYLLMYQAPANPGQAAAKLGTVKPADIDDADSLTYLYARVYDQL